MDGWELGGQESLEAWNARANDRNADFDGRPVEFVHQNPFHPVSRSIGTKEQRSLTADVCTCVREEGRTYDARYTDPVSKLVRVLRGKQ